MKKHFLLITTCLCLSACSVGPDYDAPQNNFSDQWSAGNGENAVSNAPVQLEWWKVFDDPLLEKYIDQAAFNNKDVQIALANLRRARAARREESAGFLPQFSGSAQGDRSKSSEALSGSSTDEIRNSYDAGFDASWEFDIFGGTRRAVEAADARAEGALADYHAAMLSTLAEVARNYYEARGLQKQISITEKNAQLLSETLGLIDARLQVGEASEFDLARSRGEYQLTRARLPNLRADLKASVYSLSVLLGLPPEALLDEMKERQPLPAPPDIVPVGLRSDILRRRPDVRSAERELAASVADIGVETADLFPKFFLTGDVGLGARVFSDLFTAAAGAWSFGSLMSWSVFEGGAIRARIEEQEAESEAALATYEKSVLEALADAETAFMRYGRELETRQRLEEGVQSRRQSVTLARQLFDAGEEDYLAVLDAERELTSAEDDLVVSETRSVTKLVALYTALGGGWEAFAGKKED